MSKLEVAGLGVELRGRAVLSDVSFALEQGQLLSLLGPNGVGKTTLLKALLGLIPRTRGSVQVSGRAIDELSPRERAKRLAWLPQHAALSEPLTVLEVVSAARFRFAESHRAAASAARAALERVGMAAHAEVSALELSGGERQRVALAALLAQEAEFLLLDEPANHLDPAQQLEIYRLLGELWRDGAGIVLVTHDVNLLFHLASPARVRVLGLRNGGTAFETTYASGELAEKLSSLFEVPFLELADAEQRVLVPRAPNPPRGRG